MKKSTEDRETFPEMERFVRDRITELRLSKNDLSETKLSEELGNSRTYINNITTGKSLPSLTELFKICDYFNISLGDFFKESPSIDALIKLERLTVDLEAADVDVIMHMAERLNEYKNKLKKKKIL